MDFDDDAMHAWSNAATAVLMFGRRAARYTGEIREALAQEKREEIRDILRGSLHAIE